jgi:hypothetical protein
MSIQIRILWLLLALAASFDARSYYLPLAFVPAAPTEMQRAVMEVHTGECDAVYLLNEEDRQVEVINSTVKVTIIGFTAEIEQDCIFPPNTARIRLPLLPPGTFRVELYRRPPVPMNAQPSLMQVSRLVVGSEPASVPTGSLLGGIALALALVAVAVGKSGRNKIAND